jgi:hypothetical protein
MNGLLACNIHHNECQRQRGTGLPNIEELRKYLLQYCALLQQVSMPSQLPATQWRTSGTNSSGWPNLTLV